VQRATSRRHRRHFNLASADRVLGQPTKERETEDDGGGGRVLSIPASTTARETHASLARLPAELSDKLAICQQQTPPWSRSADWHPGDNHLVAENCGSASVSPSCTPRRIHGAAASSPALFYNHANPSGRRMLTRRCDSRDSPKL